MRCRELVPAGATYCGECGQSQLEPLSGEETAGADRGVRRLFLDRPGLRRRWRLIAALAAVVTLVAAVAFSWQASPMSARDTVEAFYEALAERDADRARSMLSRDLVDRAPATLTSGGALRNPGYHPPRDLRITKMDIRDDVGEMAGEYELDGKRQRMGLFLFRDGRGGEGRPWSIHSLPGLEPPSGDYGHEALVIAGTRAPGGFIEAVFDGSYLVSLPDHPIREVTAPVTVRAGGGREQGVLRTRVRDSARESIETQVRAYLDRCAAITELEPEGCPFQVWSPTVVKDVAWRITGYPTLEITLGPDGSAQVVGSSGTATVTRGGAVIAENMSFDVDGHARAAGDKVLFVPR
ncbi:hypothetical protein [Micromonospora chersina]|uniref:hypothetical protein n=1 Tax=Micromonospora chersina TaxID=47854 RepID=UPI0037126B0E